MTTWTGLLVISALVSSHSEDPGCYEILDTEKLPDSRREHRPNKSRVTLKHAVISPCRKTEHGAIHFDTLLGLALGALFGNLVPLVSFGLLRPCRFCSSRRDRGPRRCSPALVGLVLVLQLAPAQQTLSGMASHATSNILAAHALQRRSATTRSSPVRHEQALLCHNNGPPA